MGSSLILFQVVIIRNDNGAGRGRVSLSHTHPRKNYSMIDIMS